MENMFEEPKRQFFFPFYIFNFYSEKLGNFNYKHFG